MDFRVESLRKAVTDMFLEYLEACKDDHLEATNRLLEAYGEIMEHSAMYEFVVLDRLLELNKDGDYDGKAELLSQLEKFMQEVEIYITPEEYVQIHEVNSVLT
ncbi:hypothetical protein [Paenibacillus paridis]|uniref:hypothetical protein n=1 Tax=Paenibacillus paridis TaxID=2583376 RepID=UPI001121E3D0|nr:hypothetical protein [Paenibacillus paridis]